MRGGGKKLTFSSDRSASSAMQYVSLESGGVVEPFAAQVRALRHIRDFISAKVGAELSDAGSSDSTILLERPVFTKVRWRGYGLGRRLPLSVGAAVWGAGSCHSPQQRNRSKRTCTEAVGAMACRPYYRDWGASRERSQHGRRADVSQTRRFRRGVGVRRHPAGSSAEADGHSDPIRCEGDCAAVERCRRAGECCDASLDRFIRLMRNGVLSGSLSAYGRGSGRVCTSCG